jgi:predicted ester cyclase
MPSELRSVVDQHYAGLEGGDLDQWNAAHSDDVDGYAPGIGSFKGRGSFAEFAKPFFTGFPDATLERSSVVEAGDWVIVEGSYRGTNTGPLITPQGELPPTGKSIDLRFADIFRVKDGKAVVHHLYFDQAEFMQQVGLMPAPG